MSMLKLFRPGHAGDFRVKRDYRFNAIDPDKYFVTSRDVDEEAKVVLIRHLARHAATAGSADDCGHSEMALGQNPLLLAAHDWWKSKPAGQLTQYAGALFDVARPHL